MNKLIIIDLDGTAVDSPKQKLPSDRLVSVTSRLQENYHISAATGRVWTFAKPVIQGLKLSDPCIISAGTQICDPKTGSILWQKVIKEESLNEVIDLFKQYPDWKLLHNDGTEEDYFFGGVYPNEFSNDEPVYFLEQVFVPDAVAMEIYEKVNKIDGITCVMVVSQKTGARDLHVINKEATKEHAIEELLKILKIKKENTIGVGDGHNDLHLFNAVNRKVAMGNAVDDLKNNADEIIGFVKEDGLVDFFEKLEHE